MTIEEFGQSIQAKYPQYQNKSAADVGNAMLQKYPQYQSKITQSTFPTNEPPAVKQSFMQNIGQGISQGLGQAGQSAIGAVKQIGNDVVGVGKVITTPLNAVYKGITGQEPTFNAQPQASISDAQKPAATGVQLGEFLTPGGAASDAAKAAELAAGGSKIAKVAGFGAKALTEAGSMAGITAAQGGNSQDVKNAGLLGAAFPVAGLAMKGLGKIGGAVVEHLASTLSGVPKAAIQHAIENPEAVQQAIKTAANDGEGATQKIYQNAVDALDNLKQARQDAYQQGLAKLEKEATYTKNGQLYIQRELSPSEAAATTGYKGGKIGVPTNLSTSGIKNVFTTTVKDFGAEGGGKGGLDFTNVALDDSHISKLNKLQDRIYNWNDTTPTGINKLRQVIDSYKIGGINLGSSESKFNKIIGDLRTNLANYVGDRVPQVAQMNKEYAASSQVIDNIRSQLKIGSADPNTALRKLVNVFNPKSSLYRPVVEQLGEKAGKNLMSDIAGLTMARWTPEGLGKYVATLEGGASIYNPKALAALPITAALSSPRVVGKAATTVGKIAGSEALPKIIKTASQLSKAAVIKTVTKKK